VAVENVGLMVAASAIFAAGNSTVMLTRFAVADLARPETRGRAISRSLVVTTVGAVVGPNLLGPSAALAEPLGLPPTAGLYVVAVAAFALAAALLLAAPRGQSGVPPASGDRPSPRPHGAARPSTLPQESRGGRRHAYLVQGTAHGSMVAVMALAVVHARNRGLDLDAIGFVVSLHVAAMYAPAPVVGWLCDRLTARPVATGGAVVMTGVGIAGALAEVSGMVPMTVLLLALGLAWNVQVVSGSALLVEATPAQARPVAEGRAQLTMGLAAGIGIFVAAAPLTAIGGFRLLSAAVAALGTIVTLSLALAPSDRRLRGRPIPEGTRPPEIRDRRLGLRECRVSPAS
jgi:hypothetical protein